MQNERRHFLISSATSAAVLAGLPLISTPVFASTTIPVGGASLMVLSDGNLVLPGNMIVPPDIPAEQLTSLLEKNSLSGSSSYEPACNCALWQQQDKLVLFDVGAGPNFMQSAGKLLESLEQAQIDPAEITDVVFTHAHPDHLWGLIDDFDELAFPEANYHMNAVEWDYWRGSDTIDKLPEARKVFAVGAQNRLSLLEDRIVLCNHGDEVLPGIEAVNTAGHTPGHTSFALHEGSDSVMLLGDALLHPVISFQKFDWPSGSDQDMELARQTRRKLLDRLVQDNMQLLGFHLPHPGLGHAERSDSAYRYVTG